LASSRNQDAVDRERDQERANFLRNRPGPAADGEPREAGRGDEHGSATASTHTTIECMPSGLARRGDAGRSDEPRRVRGDRAAAVILG
jgi:hypothetical protein